MKVIQDPILAQCSRRTVLNSRMLGWNERDKVWFWREKAIFTCGLTSAQNTSLHFFPKFEKIKRCSPLKAPCLAWKRWKKRGRSGVFIKFESRTLSGKVEERGQGASVCLLGIDWESQWLLVLVRHMICLTAFLVASDLGDVPPVFGHNTLAKHGVVICPDRRVGKADVSAFAQCLGLLGMGPGCTV